MDDECKFLLANRKGMVRRGVGLGSWEIVLMGGYRCS